MPHPFDIMSPWYDALYAARGKDYAAEAQRVRTHAPAGARTLLDVACGTGEHLRHLRAWFDVSGLDAHRGMLDVARAKLPGVPLHEGDMTDFDLGQRFDVVTCLFASVGYLPDEEALRNAARCFAAHGDIAIVEPALTPDRVRPAETQRDEVTVSGTDVERTTTARRDGDTLVIRFEFAGSGAEEHRIALFTEAQYRRAFTDAGYVVEWRDGLLVGRASP